AVKDVPIAATAMGSLVVVKMTQDGESKVMIRNLTMDQFIQLDKTPDLLNKPFELLKCIAKSGRVNC
ncbi:MAG TPA: hypothetical protein VK609_15785, partial [Mucilaginibacter sp.]|nr:hypothetical protein [Mucilaginibacter sp.]